MIWAQPWAFYFALASLAVVAVFLYRRRLDVIEVPSLQPYLPMTSSSSLRSWLRWLRRLLSLAVQLAIVLLLVLALAHPLRSGQDVSRLILVIDTSFTMQTKEGGRTRMERAKQLALDRVAGTPSESEVVLIQAAHTPLLLSQPTQDRDAVRQKIEELESWDVPADLTEAVGFANSMAGGHSELVVISDFQAAPPGLLRDTWKGGRITLLAAGSEQPDASVAAVSYQEDDPSPSVQAQLLQKGMAGQTVEASLIVNGRLADRQPVVLRQTTTSVVFSARLTDGDAYQVTLAPCDSLAVDDTACDVLAAGRQPVVLVTPGNPPLEQALRAIAGCDVRVLRPGDVMPPAAGVVVIDRQCPQPLSPDSGCGFLFIGTPDPFGWASDGGWAAAGAATHWSEDRQLLQDVNPLSYRVNRVLKVTWPVSWRHQELLASGDQEIMAELQPNWPGGHAPRCLYWLFDLAQTNLASKASFPLLVANAVAYLSGQSISAGPIHTGQTVHLAPSGPAPAVTNPLGQPCTPRSSGDGWVLLETVRSGLYRCQTSAGAFSIPVNVDSAQAGRSVPPGVDDPEASQSAPAWLERWTQRLRLSTQNLVLCCLALMLAEWLLFLRRIVQI